jgi:hypothetical protein
VIFVSVFGISVVHCRRGLGYGMLKNAGYVESATGAIWHLTDRGRNLLARYPDGFDDATARLVLREGRSEVGDTAVEQAEPTSGISSGQCVFAERNVTDPRRLPIDPIRKYLRGR